MFDWIKDHALEIVCGVMIATLVVALVITIVCAINDISTKSGTDMVEWIINPANPASPVGKSH